MVMNWRISNFELFMPGCNTHIIPQKKQVFFKKCDGNVCCSIRRLTEEAHPTSPELWELCSDEQRAALSIPVCVSWHTDGQLELLNQVTVTGNQFKT